MAKIVPFQAFRYSSSNQKLAKLVCPPYDVISQKQAKKLRGESGNAIHVELPAGKDLEKYLNAQNIWNSWVQKKIVQKDSEPAFYIYEQTFKIKNKSYSRIGFFCELEVEKPGAGSILRHELTLSGPKEDRLNLLRAARINTSPIFGLFDDSKKEVQEILNAERVKKPAARFSGPDRVVHKLWICARAAAVQKIQKAVQSKPVLIADGHHRYETAWNYFQETKGAVKGADKTLFFICAMNDPGLVIFPTHRVAAANNSSKPILTYDSLWKKVTALPELFQTEPCLLSDLASGKAPAPQSFAATDGKRAFKIRLKSRAALKKILKEKPASSLELPLVQLHSALLPEYKKEDFIYVHETLEALALAKKKKSLAILVPPTSTEELYGIVRDGEVMPQKSTYFYPKIITGLVFRALQ